MNPIFYEIALHPSRLSRDQQIAVLEVVDNLLKTITGSKQSIATIPYESAFLELLLVEWSEASEKAKEIAIKKLMANNGKLGDDEIENVLSLLSNEIDKRFFPQVDKKLPNIIKAGYQAGKIAPLQKYGLEIAFGAIDDTAVKWLLDHHLYWVHNYYNNQLSKAIADNIAEGMKEGLGRSTIGDRLRNFFEGYPGVGNKPDNYWRGLAANGMNRARNFGAIQAYEEIGITELTVVAVRDERTSDICEQMDGRTIMVSDAISQRNQLMMAQSPEDVKMIAPWLTPEQIRSRINLPTGRIPTSAFISNGVILPPYHFNCRSGVVERRITTRVPVAMPKSPIKQIGENKKPQISLFPGLPKEEPRKKPEYKPRKIPVVETQREPLPSELFREQFKNEEILKVDYASVQGINSTEVLTMKSKNKYIRKKVSAHYNEAVMEEIYSDFGLDLGITKIPTAATLKDNAAVMNFFQGDNYASIRERLKGQKLEEFRNAINSWVKDTKDGSDMLLIDWITSACDRHTNNVMFKYSNGKILDSALIDNGRSFYKHASSNKTRNGIARIMFNGRIERGYTGPIKMHKDTKNNLQSWLKRHGWKRSINKPLRNAPNYEEKLNYYNKSWESIGKSIKSYFTDNYNLREESPFGNVKAIDIMIRKLQNLVEDNYKIYPHWFEE